MTTIQLFRAMTCQLVPPIMHEIGHNMGMAHDRFVGRDAKPGPITRRPPTTSKCCAATRRSRPNFARQVSLGWFSGCPSESELLASERCHRGFVGAPSSMFRNFAISVLL